MKREIVYLVSFHPDMTKLIIPEELARGGGEGGEIHNYDIVINSYRLSTLQNP